MAARKKPKTYCLLCTPKDCGCTVPVLTADELTERRAHYKRVDDFLEPYGYKRQCERHYEAI